MVFLIHIYKELNKFKQCINTVYKCTHKHIHIYGCQCMYVCNGPLLKKRKYWGGKLFNKIPSVFTVAVAWLCRNCRVQQRTPPRDRCSQGTQFLATPLVVLVFNDHWSIFFLCIPSRLFSNFFKGESIFVSCLTIF